MGIYFLSLMRDYEVRHIQDLQVKGGGGSCLENISHVQCQEGHICKKLLTCTIAKEGICFNKNLFTLTSFRHSSSIILSLCDNNFSVNSVKRSKFIESQ